MHHHEHHQFQVSTNFNSAFLFAILLNFCFVLIEALFGEHANSMSLLSDAVHNLGDVLGLVLSWGAYLLMGKAANTTYSYGFKQISILAALSNALILIMSSILIAYGAIKKLIYITPVDSKIVIFVAGIGLIINFTTALFFMPHSKKDLNLKGAYLHLLSDGLLALAVVVSGLLIYWTGRMWIDPLISLIIVGVIVWNTSALLRASWRLILAATPLEVDLPSVRDYLLNLPDVIGLHDLHIWGLSTQEVALTAHLVLNEKKTFDYHSINEELSERFHIKHITLQIEFQDSDFKCCQLEHGC